MWVVPAAERQPTFGVGAIDIGGADRATVLN